MAKIEVTENIRFANEHPPRRTVHLDVNGRDFGFLYLGVDTCVVGWRGAMPFSRQPIENAAFNTVINSLSNAHQIQVLPTSLGEAAINAQAAFIYGADGDEEFDLLAPAASQRYHDIFAGNPSGISFVRYDVALRPDVLPISYAFTALNPTWSPSHSTELTLRLPKSEPWPLDLVKWMIEHSEQALDLKGHEGEIAQQIAKFRR